MNAATPEAYKSQDHDKAFCCWDGPIEHPGLGLDLDSGTTPTPDPDDMHDCLHAYVCLVSFFLVCLGCGEEIWVPT